MRVLLSTLFCLVLAVEARADRTQVFSILTAGCATCHDDLKTELKKLDGVKKARFDASTVELTVWMADGVGDDEVLAAIRRAGLEAAARAGEAAPARSEESGGLDRGFVTLSQEGEAVGPLEKHRVPGKYTVFDIYAEWCGPCRLVDARLRELAAERKDLAVRKLNVVSFESPLALELGPSFAVLPYMVVFSPDGERTDVLGADLEMLDRTLSGQ